MMDKRTKTNVDSMIYGCAKAMLMDDVLLVNIGVIEYENKKYQATLEVKEVIKQPKKKTVADGLGNLEAERAIMKHKVNTS